MNAQSANGARILGPRLANGHPSTTQSAKVLVA